MKGMMQRKKNSIIIISMIIVCIFICGVKASFAGDKIGFVQLRVLFDKYERTQVADKELSDSAAEKQGERVFRHPLPLERLKDPSDRLVHRVDRGCIGRESAPGPIGLVFLNQLLRRLRRTVL